jgi:pimeloyl-ACP methyl ester carboxylesterase
MLMRPAVKRTSWWGVLSVAGVTLAVAWPVAAQDGSEERGPGDHDQDGAHDHGRGQGPSRCSEVEFSVSLADDSPDTYRVVGELCVPRGRRADTLQILIHGSTYNRSYWDFPFQPQRYSYVRHANQSGFATLAIDRLGSGESDHPAPEIISVHGTAHTVHQIVSAVRSGSHHAADGRRLDFERIVLVGHSFGSNIAWTEAGIYGDVDGLILTAISHDMNPPAAPLTQTLSYPAAFDPAFAGAGFPLGYLTTLPGARAELFYHVPGADPDVIAVDEATKDVIPVGVLFDQFTTYGLTQNIHVPVLNVVGNFDTLACQLPSCEGSGSIANEGSNYPADADYTQLIVPDAGHSVNLHRNAPAWYRQAQAWVHDHVEPHGHQH